MFVLVFRSTSDAAAQRNLTSSVRWHGPATPLPNTLAHSQRQLELVKATFWIFNASPSEPSRLPASLSLPPAACEMCSVFKWQRSCLCDLVCLPPEFGVQLIRRVRSGGQGEMGIKLIKRLGQLRSGNGSAGGDAACTKAESARFNYNR